MELANFFVISVVGFLLATSEINYIIKMIIMMFVPIALAILKNGGIQ